MDFELLALLANRLYILAMTDEWLTLKEVQVRLGVPQHVLIHLCEKGVVLPDGGDTSGRGKWRKFSSRNLFEFALAIELRSYQLPVALTGVVVSLLRSFERAAQKSVTSFSVPESLTGKSPSLTLYLYSGEYLVFSLGNKTYIGFQLRKLIESDVKSVRPEKLRSLPKDYDSYLKLDLTSLAKRIA